MKKYAMPIIMLVVFETVAITLWLTKNNLFCKEGIISLSRIALEGKEKWVQ